jgi:hypothetical protein
MQYYPPVRTCEAIRGVGHGDVVGEIEVLDCHFASASPSETATA